MKKSTIISILVSSGMNNILERAIEIDKSIKASVPKTILVTIYLSDLPSGFTIENGKSHVTKPLEVLEYNPYKINDCYLVELPNGKQVWKEDVKYYSETKEDIVPISTIEELPDDTYIDPFADDELKEVQSDIN